MRVWRFIISGFVTRYGFQVEIGFWFRPYFWVCLLAKAIFGSAFFGIEAMPSYFKTGLVRHGDYWEFVRGPREAACLVHYTC